MNIQNPEIVIAQKAKEAIDRIQPETEFKNYLKGLPSNIVQNGLIQTIAFIKGKSDSEKHKILYQTLGEFFVTYFRKPDGTPFTRIDLLRYLTDNLTDLTAYIFYQKEILTFCIWLKRFGNAFEAAQPPTTTTN